MSGVIVGRSELESRDASRRIARGAFRPGLGYELAQPVFDLFDAAGADALALERYRSARDALRLQLTDASGRLVSVRDLRIRREPVAAGGAARYVIEVETEDAGIWEPGAED